MLHSPQIFKFWLNKSLIENPQISFIPKLIDEGRFVAYADDLATVLYSLDEVALFKQELDTLSKSHSFSINLKKSYAMANL